MPNITIPAHCTVFYAQGGSWTNASDQNRSFPVSDFNPNTPIQIRDSHGVVVWENDSLATAPPPNPIIGTSVVYDYRTFQSTPSLPIRLKLPEYEMDKNDPEQFYNKSLLKVLSIRSRQTGQIGLEIECEGTKLFDKPFVHWSCHQDGSLRETGPGNPPVEYVLKEPLSYEETNKALRYLESKLKQAGSSVVHSSRTSVHVHINCQDLTVRQLYCYVLLYLIFEEILVEWSGPERAGNLFCLRARDSDFYISMLESVLLKKNFKLWREEFRYAACNVASIPKFGSLEFRSLRGTVDVDLIMTWIDMLLHLRKKALEYDNPIEIVEEFIRIGPLPFFQKIFDDERLRNFLQPIADARKLWDGLRLMRDVAYSCEWEKPLKKSTDQESQEQVRDRPWAGVRTGDRIYILELSEDFFDVRSYECSQAARDFFVRTLDGQRYKNHVPAGHTIYFVVPRSWNGDWFELDIREGQPE